MSDMQKKMERLKFYLESCPDKTHGYIEDIDDLAKQLDDATNPWRTGIPKDEDGYAYTSLVTMWAVRLQNHKGKWFWCNYYTSFECLESDLKMTEGIDIDDVEVRWMPIPALPPQEKSDG